MDFDNQQPTAMSALDAKMPDSTEFSEKTNGADVRQPAETEAGDGTSQVRRGEVGWHRAKAKQHGTWFASLCIQIAFLLGVCYVGNAISEYLPVPVPGNICSMALLLTLLVTGIINVEKISIASNFLLSYMPVFFIPAGVTILTCLPIIQGHIPQFVAVCAITTVVVFLVTATTVMFVSRIQRAVAVRRAVRNMAKAGLFAARAREE